MAQDYVAGKHLLLPAIQNAWTNQDTALSNTTLKVQFGKVSRSGASLVLSGDGGTGNGTYYVCSSTNLALAATNWTRVLTNTFNSDGSFNLTLPLNPTLSQEFLRLQVPQP